MSYIVWKDWTPDFIRDMGDGYNMNRFSIWMPTGIAGTIALFSLAIGVTEEGWPAWLFFLMAPVLLPAPAIELVHHKFGRHATFRNSYAPNFYTRYQKIPEHYKRDLAPLADRVFKDARGHDNWSSKEDIATFGRALTEIETLEQKMPDSARERAESLITSIQQLKGMPW